MFYEGFTNKQYICVHSTDSINELCAPYFQIDGNRYTISDENIVTMAAALVKKFNRITKWDQVVSSFKNLDINTLGKISDAVRRIVD